MKYLVDVDGVICDFVSGYCELVRTVTGRRYSLEDVTDWNFNSLGLTDDERTDVHALLFKPGFVENLAAIPGSYDGITKLREAGHAVVFVTSPWRGHPTWAFERETWLHSRFQNAEIVSTAHKQHIAGDVMIDDKPEHVMGWRATNREGLGIVWDAPYNRTFEADGQQVCRALTWLGVRKLVHGPGAT